MDLEIRTGLLESRKLNTVIEITIPRDVLLLGCGCGQRWFFPDLPLLVPPAQQPWGCGHVLCRSPQLPRLPRKAGCEQLAKEPVWQSPRPSPTPLLNHALSLLKMRPELGNLKEGLIKGNGKITQSGERLFLIGLLLEAFKVVMASIFLLNSFDFL